MKFASADRLSMHLDACMTSVQLEQSAVGVGCSWSSVQLDILPIYDKRIWKQVVFLRHVAHLVYSDQHYVPSITVTVWH